MCEASHYQQRSKARPFQLPLGRVVATGGAIDALVNAGDLPSQFIDRHERGDWGNVSEEHRRLNDDGAAIGGLVVSVYRTSAGADLWIVTEPDRSATTLTLPEEY